MSEKEFIQMYGSSAKFKEMVSLLLKSTYLLEGSNVELLHCEEDADLYPLEQVGIEALKGVKYESIIGTGKDCQYLFLASYQPGEDEPSEGRAYQIPRMLTRDEMVVYGMAAIYKVYNIKEVAQAFGLIE